MTLKKYQKAIIITVSVLIAVVAAVIGFFFALDSLHHTHPRSESSIAEEDYGCDDVIWYTYCNSSNAALPDDVHITTEYVCCMAAEKDGEEVMLFLPYDSKKENGFFAKWKFDYTFTEIVTKMEFVGIECSKFGCLYHEIYLVDSPLHIDEEINLGSFDFPAYFQCETNSEQPDIVYIVAQKNHELKIYEFNRDTQECTVLC